MITIKSVLLKGKFPWKHEVQKSTFFCAINLLYYDLLKDLTVLQLSS